MAVELTQFLLASISSPTAILISFIVAISTFLLISQLNIRYLLSPGPWGLPIVGFYPFLREDDYQIQLTELSKKYGDVYIFSMLGKKYLHLGSHKSVREALLNKADCFVGRPKDFSLFQFVFQDGIFYIDGEEWKTIRKYLVQGMKEMGIGPREQIKNPLSSSIETTISYLREQHGKPINIAEFLFTQCTEVIRRLILGDNISFETAQELQNAYLECSPAPTVANLFAGNLAKHLVLRWTPAYKTMFAAKAKLLSVLKKILDEHKATFDPENPKDLIDVYLRDKKLKEDKGDPHAKYFTDIALMATIIQLYGDGGSGIGALISFYLKLLAENKTTQEELYEEIKSEIGLNRLPTYEDRKQLSLMNSVLKEMDRQFASFVAITGLEASCDTTISSVFVPKGTIIIENFNAIHSDPTTYKDPEQFNPRRFLVDNNKKVREELPALFSVGKRSCAGESLVSTEVFVFITAIVQNFTVRLASEEEIKTLNTVTLGPLECILVATSRE